MNAQDFAYWLQGFAELNEEPPTAEQWKAIRDHLALVFNKVTPPYHSPFKPNPAIAPVDWRPTVVCQTPAGGQAVRATC